MRGNSNYTLFEGTRYRTLALSVLHSPARTRPCQRLTSILTNDGPSLGVEVVARLLLPAGLSPAVHCHQFAWRTQS